MLHSLDPQCLLYCVHNQSKKRLHTDELSHHNTMKQHPAFKKVMNNLFPMHLIF